METEKQDLKLEIAQKKFVLKTQTGAVEKEKLTAEILDVVLQKDLAPLYEYLCSELGWTIDQTKLADMQAKNKAKLEELDAKIKDAEENFGESEVRDALMNKASYLAEIGDRQEAFKAFKATEEKTAGAALKVDLMFAQIRLCILYEDWPRVKTFLASAKQLCEEGADWERKNRFKVYQGVLALYSRDFATASSLFLDSIATFTTSELFPYSQLIWYAVLTSLICLDRPALKARIVESPEVLSVIDTLPNIATLLASLYTCRYKSFFRSFVGVIDQMRADMYCAPHVRYYSREIKVVAYSQFIASYKSVTLDSMAASFDVSPDFLDGEVADVIVSGRLNAKIDKVSGIIETNRPDNKNALYQETIKKGDLLLNRIQKLSKVIDIE